MTSEIVRPSREAVRAFAERLGFDPASPRLAAALTHKSAAASVSESSERLEFLGDALVGAFVARFLLDALPPDTDEGTLSRARVAIIRRETLALAAQGIGVPDLLVVGNGERRAGRHTHDGLLADAYEALVGALFLDHGEAATQQFLRETLAGPLAAVAAAPPAPDAKTTLQMRLQSEGKGLPRYRTISEEGGGHDHQFTVEVLDTAGAVLGRGVGVTKRAAQTEAARSALAPSPARSPATPE
ncbi:MAG: ribonuclease III [Cytophagales bacterium]|nr:ribonuclease III [Armatimonadota bacterium]